MSFGSARRALLDDPSLAGRALCRAYTDLVDRWLTELVAGATAEEGGPAGVALAAVGGYGRGELSPQSDIDVVLVHGGHDRIGGIADRVWYPIWDEGLKLGHSVRTPKEALALAADDLDTATSLLHVRHIVGDEALTGRLADRALTQWQKRSRRWLAELSVRVAQRHARAGEVAFLLEPDLKEGRGGLRDVHALSWAGAARTLLWDGDASVIEDAYDVLLGARVELGRRAGRPGDRLSLQDQDGVAEALGIESADDLMARVAVAARTIAWRSDDAWQRIDASLVGPFGRLARRDRAAGDGLVVRDDEVHLSSSADLDDPTLALRAAAVAAGAGTRIHRASLDRLVQAQVALPEPWTPGLRQAFVDLLLVGPAALGVVEALDQVGIWSRLLPEWTAVRSKPQRNAYHRFTVDRHLVAAALGAAELAGSVRRSDLLVVGALLHDIGKGQPGDHTEVGIGLVSTIADRMGFDEVDVATLGAMVRHHLLLSEVATRRDLDDPATVTAVADAVCDRGTLELLAALTEADSVATGPAAWSSWKAELVRELVRRTAHVLGGGAVEDLGEAFPDEAQLELLRAGRPLVEGSGDRLTIVGPDRHGLFSRVAGTLALHGLAVLEANAATADGSALEVFRVESTLGPTFEWGKVLVDLDKVLAGRLALQARLAERAQVYGSRRRVVPGSAEVRVHLDNAASADATVVEVHAPDAVGLLHGVTRTLADLDLEITSARVETLGARVVDAFYVRDARGAKLEDPALLVEVERALLHELTIL